LFAGTQKLSASSVKAVYLWSIKGKHVGRVNAGSTQLSLIFYVWVLELSITYNHTRLLCTKYSYMYSTYISMWHFRFSHLLLWWLLSSGCDAVLSGPNLLHFLRNLLPPCSLQTNELFNILSWSWRE